MNEQLFHAIDPSDRIFCHNIGISAGRVIGASYQRGVDSALIGVRSPYEAFTQEAEKEVVFESIRAKHYAAAPSRSGAIFMFDSVDQAKNANCKWWNGQRVILVAEIEVAKSVGKFDSILLDASRDLWEAAAHRYWSGVRSASSQIEVLVNGVIQLRDWQPYARLLV